MSISNLPLNENPLANLTKEQALEELIKITPQVQVLIARRNSLKAIVLGETLPSASGPKPLRVANLTERILVVLREADQSLTPRDIAERGGLNIDSVYSALDRLCKKQNPHVCKNSDNKFELIVKIVKQNEQPSDVVQSLRTGVI